MLRLMLQFMSFGMRYPTAGGLDICAYATAEFYSEVTVRWMQQSIAMHVWDLHGALACAYF